MRTFLKYIFIATVVITGLSASLTVFAAGNIDATQKYSQFLDADLDNNGVKDFISWNLPTSGKGATVTDTKITGYIWGEGVGWINMSPAYPLNSPGVSNSCSSGILGGYAWGENTGWINFAPLRATGINQPKIDTTTGKITGTVWSQNYGWIQLSAPTAPSATSYDPSVGLVTSWRPGMSGGGGSDGVCGSSNGQSLTSAPSAGLCSSGTPSAVVGSPGAYLWTCSPTSICGMTANCIAKALGGTGGPETPVNTITVTKYVVSNSGGTATSNDFIINVTNTTTGVVISKPSSGTGAVYSVTSGSFIVSENPVTGYTPTYGGDCAADGSVTLLPNVSNNKSCTVTNYYGTVPTFDYCLNISMLSISDALTQGYTLSYNSGLNRYSCLKISNPPQPNNYCLNVPTLLVSDALIDGYYTTATSNGYNCFKNNNPDPEDDVQYCKNNGALSLSDASADGYIIDSQGNCMLVTGFVCQNLGPNISSIPLGYHFSGNGDCVPDTIDYCPQVAGDQLSPADCPDPFTDALGTSFGGLLEKSSWLTALLTALGLIGIASSLPAVVSRIGNIILTFAFGRKKWRGIVYDSELKEPLDPAYVSVIDVITGQEVANQFTDMEGRFGFVLKPGKYKITAAKTNYAFPSTKLEGRYSDEIYDHLYYGEIFTVEDPEQVVTMNIPMDPIAKDWNQQEKHRMHFIKYLIRGQTKYGWIWNISIVIGFLSSIMITYFYPVWWNYVMTAMYVVLALFYVYGKGPISAGKITKNGIPLQYAIIRIYNANLDHEVAHTVTSSTGHYYALIKRAKYYITVEQKNADGTYAKIFTSDTVWLSQDLINKSFDIS